MLDEKMNILPLPEVKIKKDPVNAANFFGKTAYYDPNNNEIVLYTEGRINNIKTDNTNKDSSLLELEKEAYLKGNITFRNWEDKIKNK